MFGFIKKTEQGAFNGCSKYYSNKIVLWQRKTLLVIVPVLFCLKFTLVNFLYCLSLSYTFPFVKLSQIDLNAISNPSISLGNQTRHSDIAFVNHLLNKNLRDDYSSFRLENETEIIIQPSLYWSPFSISFKLQERQFNFKEGRILVPETSITTMWTKTLKQKPFPLTFSDTKELELRTKVKNFIRQRIFTSLQNENAFSDYDVDKILQLLLFIRFGNFGILCATVLLSLTVALFVLCGCHTMLSLYLTAIASIFLGCAMITFTICNLIVTVLIDLRYANRTSHRSISILLFQLIIYLLFTSLLGIEFKRKEAERKEKILIASFSPSPSPDQGTDKSSIYSNLSSFNPKKDDSRSENPSLVINSLDPMKRVDDSKLMMYKTHFERMCSEKD
ncbi:uncharacterized protein PRCAT00001202001 [Priceomyces carsonii]|uniref:uncharacterized protein n=1 Tax=Priceomyces carsonii TaxID=28549 RepID=UPI002ED7D8AD|nr:unnamed protein product [Priceomyces carsonii]